MGLRFKRIVDLLAALLGLVLLSPVLLVIAVVAWLKMGSPVIFRQLRPGYKGRPFTIYKFRTMREAHDAKGKALSDAERLTSFGKLLRTTSLDELPELWNVVKGEMSLVGPRPLLMEYLEHYSPQQARRHEAIPGITGWAQVNGRNAITWEQRFEYDIWYVDVCGPLESVAGFTDSGSDSWHSAQARRHFASRPRDRGGVSRDRGLEAVSKPDEGDSP